jgi:hypothetical protein
MRFSTVILFIIGVVNLKGDLSHGRMSIIPEYDQNNVTILFSGHRADDTPKTAFLFTVPLDVDSVSLIKSNANGTVKRNAVFGVSSARCPLNKIVTLFWSYSGIMDIRPWLKSPFKLTTPIINKITVENLMVKFKESFLIVLSFL